MNTFTKEIAVPGFEPQETNEGAKLVKVNKPRVFTFKELDEFDQDQQTLIFKLNAVFENAFSEDDEKVGVGKRKITIETDGMHELLIKFINICLVTKNDSGDIDGNKELDKKELLMSSRALWKLGSWLTVEKFLPFFLQLNEN